MFMRPLIRKGLAALLVLTALLTLILLAVLRAIVLRIVVL